MGWTGNLGTCAAGTTDPGFRELVGLRINFFRALAGVPAAIAMDDNLHAKAQQAALMMSANHTLHHFPPAEWTCYTAGGAEAAQNANLAIGQSGPAAIDGYMQDFGLGNAPVGHRRWILYPQTRVMATGDVPDSPSHLEANAIWVFDGNYGGPRPATRTPHVCWPPPGYVPYPVVPVRWSFAYPGADFFGATVTMTSKGQLIPVTLELVRDGFGENTLVWYPSSLDPGQPYAWPRPSADTAYAVTVRNVRLSGNSQDFSYTVTVFDPAVAGSDTVLPTLSGPDDPVVNQPNAFTFVPVNKATGYQWRSFTRTPLSAVEGAENGLAHWTAATTPGYDPVVSSPRASGSYAFHLAHPQPQDQRLTYQRTLLPSASARLEFKSRLGWAAPGQVAKVQVSLNQGQAWEDVYNQAGSDTQGELGFTTRTVSLSAFAGRLILLRLNYSHTTGSYFPQTTPGIGWYIDDLVFSEVEELTNPMLHEVASGSAFDFVPEAVGDYALMVRAEVYDRFHLEWGPVKKVAATAPVTPPLRFVGRPVLTASQVQIEFEVRDYRPGMVFRLYRAASVVGPWQHEAAASFQPVVANSRFRATATLSGSPQAFYQLRAD